MRPTELEGARTHNLQSVSVTVRPGEVTVLSGVSGAGKSSLALDTLYAEGQRRFVESFSPYARQFLERLERPPVDRLDPVPAGVAVDRRAPVKSSRSTVATMADLEPYLAALFLRNSVPTCAEHGVAAIDLDVEQAARRAENQLAGQRAVVSYRTVVDTAEQYLELRDSLVADGYRRLWLDGATHDIDTVKPSRIARDGRADVVLDRLSVDGDAHARLSASIEAAWTRAEGTAHVQAAGTPTDDSALLLRRGLSCPVCAVALPRAAPGLFSYDSPLGACGTCRGFGRTIGIDWNRVIPDPSRSLNDGAIAPWSTKKADWERKHLRSLAKKYGIPLATPWCDLDREHQSIVREGRGRDWGVTGWFAWLEGRTYKMHVRVLLSRYRAYEVCTACKGQRLGEHALRFQIDGANIAEWRTLEIGRFRHKLRGLSGLSGQSAIARRELDSRLSYLEEVGLGYLTLDRQARTLSGGEAQRVTLTAALGTSLHNALFVLDEPTVGLHPADVDALGKAIDRLAERNNAVVVVEHDARIVARAARVVELGPGAGPEGGAIVADATPRELLRTKSGATARTLQGLTRRTTTLRSARGALTVRGARENNLANVDVTLPLGVLCAITGPSGSGKSTLAVDVIHRAVGRALGDLKLDLPGAHTSVEGASAIRRVVLVDQSPLGRTSRGNAATYTKAWEPLRNLFARTPLAREQGFTASHFSFNVSGGRCETCHGDGFETVEMQFLADVRLVCPVCQGQRFRDEVLRVEHAGVNVARVLQMSVSEALDQFRAVAAVQRALGPLGLLGLGYLRLGQPLSTLSGGEAQRLKIARVLGEDLEGALLILDEPSAGLHVDEVSHLLAALDAIIKGGASVVVVEHDLDIIANSDFVIDIGPGAGSAGGHIVATGTPAEVARQGTLTGKALAARTRPRFKRQKTLRKPPAHALAVEHAREHNLKDISVALPHSKLSVVTGPSGSGKSSLAFDVVFAEGQRRFLETLTPYARQFLPTMPRPDVDAVIGVPPAVALEQRSTRAGARSTVATVTEVAHYMRLLFAKLGTPHCPEHDQPIRHTSADRVFGALRADTGRGALQLTAPVVRSRKGSHAETFANAARAGIMFAICDGARVATDPPPKLARTRTHDIDLVIAEAEAARDIARADFERALGWGNGAVFLQRGATRTLYSTVLSCDVCGKGAPEFDPRHFSFNTVQGQCTVCEGSGVAKHDAPKKPKRRSRKKVKKQGPVALDADAAPAVDGPTPCPACEGTRLAPLPRAVRVNGTTYAELNALSVEATLTRVERLEFEAATQPVAEPILAELRRRLHFLRDVGLGYLGLGRSAHTLSGGEMQRLRLAAQLGAGLTGALYILDEPTIGLHPRDTARLLANLRALVDLGSTVLVVEHDEDTIRAADHLIDLGPGGGAEGGSVIAEGPPSTVLASPASPTGRVLREPPRLRTPRAGANAAPRICVSGATAHNLDHATLSIPVGHFVVVGGVSGSGKSTLVRQVFLPALRQKLGLAAATPGPHAGLEVPAGIVRAVEVDQSPIGRTPRSVPASFLGLWDAVRKLFASSPEAQVAGFDATRFSFNAARGGRCEQCSGQGVVTHEMSFLPDVIVTCPTCEGSRFEPRTRDIRYLDHSIADVLALSAADAAELFQHHPRIASPLRTLTDLGAGYIRLGQGSHTLSGGEAQRLKLAAELTATTRHEPTVYVLDEPTTGLHLSDVHRLMSVLDRLVQRGDTLVVIEHHPLVLAGADWLIELGPEGGAGGGRVIAETTPRALARKKTPTGLVLRDLFERAG